MKIEKKLKSRKGFTLVELVVVIAVLAILAGVGAVAYSGYIKRANQAADYTCLDSILTAASSACATKGETVTKVVVSISEKKATTIKVTTSDTTDTTFGTTDGGDIMKDSGAIGTAFNDFIKTDDLKFSGEASSYTWSSTGDNAGEWVEG